MKPRKRKCVHKPMLRLDGVPFLSSWCCPCVHCGELADFKPLPAAEPVPERPTLRIVK